MASKRIPHHNTAVQVFALLVGAVLMLTASDAFAAGGGAHGASHVDWKHFIGTVLNFILFAGIIYMAAGRKVQDFFKERKEALEFDLNEATRLRDEAVARLREYQGRLDALEQERQALLDEYHKQGQREKERLVEDAERQSKKLYADAELMIQQETKRAIDLLEEKAVDHAIALAQELVVERLKEEEAQKEIVKGYLQELDGLEFVPGLA